MFIYNDWETANSKEYYKTENIKQNYNYEKHFNSFLKRETQLNNKESEMQRLEEEIQRERDNSDSSYKMELKNIQASKERLNNCKECNNKKAALKEIEDAEKLINTIHDNKKKELDKKLENEKKNLEKIYAEREDHENKDIKEHPLAFQNQSPEVKTPIQNQPNVSINETTKQPEAISSGNTGSSDYSYNYDSSNTSTNTYTNTNTNTNSPDNYSSTIETEPKGKGTTVTIVVLLVLVVLAVSCIAIFVKKFKAKDQNIIKKTLNKKNANSDFNEINNEDNLTPFPPLSSTTEAPATSTYQPYSPSTAYPETNANAASFMEHNINSYVQPPSNVNGTDLIQATTVDIPYDQPYVTGTDTVALTSSAA